jgi:hypothetical protein
VRRLSCSFSLIISFLAARALCFIDVIILMPVLWPTGNSGAAVVKYSLSLLTRARYLTFPSHPILSFVCQNKEKFCSSLCSLWGKKGNWVRELSICRRFCLRWIIQQTHTIHRPPDHLEALEWWASRVAKGEPRSSRHLHICVTANKPQPFDTSKS